MCCHHEGQELVWETTVEILPEDDFAYKYVVINSEHKAVRQEQCRRKLQLPCNLPPHSLIQLEDAWEVRMLALNAGMSTLLVDLHQTQLLVDDWLLYW